MRVEPEKLSRDKLKEANYTLLEMLGELVTKTVCRECDLADARRKIRKLERQQHEQWRRQTKRRFKKKPPKRDVNMNMCEYLVGSSSWLSASVRRTTVEICSELPPYPLP